MNLAEEKKKKAQGDLECICLSVEQYGPYCSLSIVLPLSLESRCASEDFLCFVIKMIVRWTVGLLQNQNSLSNDFSSSANFFFFSSEIPFPAPPCVSKVPVWLLQLWLLCSVFLKSLMHRRLPRHRACSLQYTNLLGGKRTECARQHESIQKHLEICWET